MTDYVDPTSDAPNYEREIDPDELLRDLADVAADYATDVTEKRRWMDDAPVHDPFYEARYWMLEALGGRRAVASAIVTLQPGDRFRDGDAADVRGFLGWCSERASEAHERSYGPYTETRQADEAESAYCEAISLVREEYDVGWPRMDTDGNALEADLP